MDIFQSSRSLRAKKKGHAEGNRLKKKKLIDIQGDQLNMAVLFWSIYSSNNCKYLYVIILMLYYCTALVNFGIHRATCQIKD